MSSKFWGAEASSNSSDYEDSEGGAVDEQPQPQLQTKKKEWAAIKDSSSSDGEQKRIIKSEKDKRWDSMRVIVRKLAQHQKNQDYAEIDDDFDNLMKTIAKSQKILEAEGPPKFFIRAVVELQDYVEEKHKDKAALKKCSRLKASAINKLQKRLPKVLQDFKVQVEQCREDPSAFRSGGENENVEEDSSQGSSDVKASSDSSAHDSADSDSSSSEEKPKKTKKKRTPAGRASSSSSSQSSSESSSGSSSSERDSDAEQKVAPKTKKAKKASAPRKSSASSASGSSFSSSSASQTFDSSDDDSSSSSAHSGSSVSSVSSRSALDEEAPGLLDYETRHARAMVKWGVKATKGAGDEQKAAKREAVGKRQAERRKMAVAHAAKVAETGPVVATRRTSTFLPNGGEGLDDKTVLSKAKEIVAVRGKRGAERQEQLGNLAELAEIAKRRNLYQTYLEILNYLVTLQLDVTHMASGGILSVADWQHVYQDLMALFSLVATRKDLSLSFSLSSEMSPNDGLDEPLANTDAAPEGAGASGQPPIPDGFTMSLSFVERLDDCLVPALQGTDAHSKEYRERLTQTIDSCALLWLVWTYFQGKIPSATAEIYRVAVRLAEHLYYLPDRLSTPRWVWVKQRIPEAVWNSISEMGDFVTPPQVLPSRFLAILCSYGSKQVTAPASARLKFRMAMFSIYNMALHDKFYEARDALQAGNYHEQALSHHIPEQVLYNRCLCQVGLAAFRTGKISLTASVLSEICGSSKQRELLAQGVAIVKGFEKTAEQEKAERRRLLPTHLHINLDVLESAYNICSMLVEVPQMCSQQPQNDSEMRYRTFRYKRALELFEKSSTPPESSREFVLAAAKHLMKGNWRAAQQLVATMKFWDHIIPEETAKRVQKVLENKMREVALQAYIHHFSRIYQSISITQLSHIFEIRREAVLALISELIIKKEISGYLDADSETVLIRQLIPTQLQQAALKLAEQLSNVLDQSEAIYSMKFSSGATDRQKKPFSGGAGGMARGKRLGSNHLPGGMGGVEFSGME